ncbi:unnamed protein product [Cuscuta campestris]|uniref:Retrotransposon gag domain-containing protein n=1 Tax=Cuscuta campestris TaxID=132261 RepID=A0A484MRF0_9ASTE|nr:unnamed protein product [Cuscuta campestris]
MSGWKRASENAPEPLTWAYFDSSFQKEYIPPRFREGKWAEFVALSQGDMTLPEFRQRFDHLAQFAGTLVEKAGKGLIAWKKSLLGSEEPSTQNKGVGTTGGKRTLGGGHSMQQSKKTKRYRSDPSHILPEGTVTLDESLSYEEEPVQILAREVKELRNKSVPLVKVLWRNHSTEEATWETEESMRTHVNAERVVVCELHAGPSHGRIWPPVDCSNLMGPSNGRILPQEDRSILMAPSHGRIWPPMDRSNFMSPSNGWILPQVDRSILMAPSHGRIWPPVDRSNFMGPSNGRVKPQVVRSELYKLIKVIM